MNLSALQTAVIAGVAQVVAAVVGFGILNSTEGGLVITATTAVVNVVFILVSGLHSVKQSVDANTAARTGQRP